MDGTKCAFRQGVDLNRQVAEVVQVNKLCTVVVLFPDRIIENGFDFICNISQIALEEMLVEIVDQILLTKCLDAEDDNAVDIGQAGHARGKVAGQLGRSLGKLAGMCGFVEVTEKHRIDTHL